MNTSDEAYRLADALLASLPYNPNGQQIAVAAAMARFCIAPCENVSPVFILNGYAGTGKTSLTAALARVLPSIGMKTVLLAPTGRAAKVISAYAGMNASTIHRRIYRHSLHGEVPAVRDNRSKDTLFIVDEASMIPGPDGLGNDLLADLIHYVYTGDNCRMLLMGDTAQLPPVGSPFSPAMDKDTLKSYGLKVSRATMTAIARQLSDSGILYNATLIRRAMTAAKPLPELFNRPFPDIKKVTRQDLPDVLNTVYSTNGVDSAVVITRSNRDASAYNAAIRAGVLYFEDELMPGELLVVAKNNYSWTRGVKGVDFVANGDIVQVVRVISSEIRFGCRFADVELTFPDTEKNFTAKIMLDTLTGDAAAMPVAKMTQLVADIADYIRDNHVGDDPESRLAIMEMYADALQVKYAYAVTCHKAQGGQWSDVFVDVGYLPPDADQVQYMRWLYTAVTRAVTRLYVIC